MLLLRWRVARRNDGKWSVLPIPEPLYATAPAVPTNTPTSASDKATEASGSEAEDGGKKGAKKETSTKTAAPAATSTTQEVIGVKGGNVYTPISLLPKCVFSNS